jgi:hypothetical protein
MAKFLANHENLIDEMWEPGYYLATPTYFKMMDTIAGMAKVAHSQPASGTTRFIDQVKVTVLAPAVSLKNRYDSYGIDVNNSSIALRIDFPARRYYQREKDGSFEKLPKGASLILGADAQTLSWAQVMIDFPCLGPSDSAVAKALRKARGVEPLRANVFKVPHHCSKHGLNLELVEEIQPSISLISSVREGGSYNFPHVVSLEALREGIEPTAQKGKAHKDDFDLGIHFTSGRDDSETDLGTIAIVLGPTGRSRVVWRFGDSPTADIDLAKARSFRVAELGEEPDQLQDLELEDLQAREAGRYHHRHHRGNRKQHGDRQVPGEERHTGQDEEDHPHQQDHVRPLLLGEARGDVPRGRGRLCLNFARRFRTLPRSGRGNGWSWWGHCCYLDS